jgi:FlaA1/EpsC-like NDP-sugar epimerase
MQIGRQLATLPPGVKMGLMVGSDAVFLPLCVLAAVGLRLGSMSEASTTAPGVQVLIGLLTLPVLASAGLYRAVVRYMDVRVVAASGLSLLAVVLTVFVATLILDVRVLPRSALPIYWFIAFTYVITSRFMARSILRRGLGRPGRPRIPTAIYGAGEAGAQLAHAMQFSVEYRAACFIDDHRALHHKNVAGLRVYPREQLDAAISRHDIGQVVVAIPSAGPARRREIIAAVEPTGLPVKILPRVSDLLTGEARLSDIRELDLADLLGRDPVPPDPALFARNIHGKCVLVTGAGGSIGSELCRQILSQHPRRLVLFDHSEYALYAIDQELSQHAGGVEIITVLGSVLDLPLIVQGLRRHQVQTVYHAAAYKHVPIVEANVRQGLLNNVVGSMNIARACAECGVETCVLVSTDKAVRPTNVMGASKRAAELVFQAHARRGGHGTTFAMVRFGNVLGSSGSVVPLFRRQIQAGGPVTITHPDIIRYFMLIPEAAQLVIQAGAMARGGEVFVLDMGEPVRIADLARSMIRLSGLTERTPERPAGDIEIRYVGLRPGEKLFEELLIGNDAQSSQHPRILCAHEHHIEPSLLDKMVDSLRRACEQDDDAAVLRQLRNLVPELRSPDEVNAEARAQVTQY